MRERSEPAAVALAVFIAGAAVLAMEIAASRVLAPFFGNSLYVWGALIGVVLTALAIGYWAGGALADRVPRLGLLLGAIAVGACAVLAVPILDDAILEQVVSWDPGPRANPVVATVALFGLPSIVLAMVTPIAVRLSVEAVTRVGRTAGRLFAISTTGSIVGTFATAFWLIPEFGTDQLLGFVAAVLFLAATLVAAAQRLPFTATAGVAATVAAGAAAFALAPASSGIVLSAESVRNWSPLYRQRGGVAEQQPPSPEGFRLVYRKDTAYHRLAVMDDGDSRYLRFSNSFQSGMWLARPFATRFRYADYFDLGLAYNPRARNILMIGLGGGSAPKRMWRDFPRLQIQVVELDPEVVRVAYRYFELPRSDRLRVEVQDGRRFLARDSRRWDLIAIDAYYADSVPFHLTTREFYELVQQRLNPGGVVMVNVIGALRGPSSKLFRAFYRTHRSVFPTVAVHPVFENERATEDVRNIIIVSTDRPQPEKGFLLGRWRQIRTASAPSLAVPIRDRWNPVIPIADVPTLTDDYAPTDALILD
jgi:spermidine synthase